MKKEYNFYTYILVSGKTGRYYSGQTNNVEDRLKRHNREEDPSTRYGIPWSIRWKKGYQTRSEAMAMERRIKNMKSRKSIEEMIRKSETEKGE